MVAPHVANLRLRTFLSFLGKAGRDAGTSAAEPPQSDMPFFAAVTVLECGSTIDIVQVERPCGQILVLGGIGSVVKALPGHVAEAGRVRGESS
jgi:hypothetical protein